MKCWGGNYDGQLGYGNTENIGDDELPSSVGFVSVTTTPGVTVTSLTAGQQHVCALLSDGTVRCWGDNAEGQLGYGNIETTTPARCSRAVR
jgi:alpha-tubulin suppressor-like RCC1 family protein